MPHFRKNDEHYPIRGVLEDISGVSYRTGRKGWIYSRVMVEWASEKRSLPDIHIGRKRVLFDNCYGHNVSDALRSALKNVNQEIRYFTANVTDLRQTAEYFII